MGRYPMWTEAEHDYLENLVGNYPFKEVVQKYQRKAKKEGWPRRSSDAIKVRVSRHIGSRKAIDKNFTYHTLAKILGYNRERVRIWYRQGKLAVKKVGPLTRISNTDLNDFADRYPHLLSDADFFGLAFLFGKERARQIKELPSAVTQPRPIRCLQTGRVFPSINEAARACFMHKTSIRNRAKNRNGFEFVEAS